MATVITKRVNVVVTEYTAGLIRDTLLDTADFVAAVYDPEDPEKDRIVGELKRVAKEFEDALPVASFTDPNDFKSVEIFKG
jgi:hypothetical protein